MPLRTATPVPRQRAGAFPPSTLADLMARKGGQSETERLLERALAGKLNCTGEVTLSVTPATTTVYSDPRITAQSVVLMVPTTANAAALMSGAAGIYVVPADGSATFTHAASASVDLTFRIAVFG